MPAYHNSTLGEPWYQENAAPLRLGVGAHLALRSLKPLREVIEALESRYQVSVSVGQSDREIADRMLHGGHPQSPKLPFVWDQHPWRVI